MESSSTNLVNTCGYLVAVVGNHTVCGGTTVADVCAISKVYAGGILVKSHRSWHMSSSQQQASSPDPYGRRLSWCRTFFFSLATKCNAIGLLFGCQRVPTGGHISNLAAAWQGWLVDLLVRGMSKWFELVSGVGTLIVPAA